MVKKAKVIKVLGVPLIVIVAMGIALLIGAGIAYGVAVLTVEIPSTAYIQSDYDLTAWEDQAHTVSLTQVDFGVVPTSGSSDPVDLWIWNEGADVLYCVVDEDGTLPNGVNFNFGSSYLSLQPDDCGKATVFLTTSGTVESKTTVNFNIVLTGHDTPPVQ